MPATRRGFPLALILVATTLVQEGRCQTSWLGRDCLAVNPQVKVYQGTQIVGTAKQLDPISRINAVEGDWLGVQSPLINGWVSMKDMVPVDDAVDYFTRRIASQPSDAAAYTARGIAWRVRGDYERAIADHHRAIELDSQPAAAYANRGNAYAHQGRHDLALADYRQAIALDPELLAAHNNLAWSLATRPERELRDGPAAVASAKKACELTHWQNAACIDTLAAAHAESGDFQQAIDFETRAIALATPPLRIAFENRLQLYRGKQPFHELAPRTDAAAVIPPLAPR